MTLSCTVCAKGHSPHELQTVCAACGQPLRADYFFTPDKITPDDLDGEHPTLWRYRPFLPSVLAQACISLGEGQTPLLERKADGRTFYLKDETQNPTGSFKDRGMCLALSVARALGIKKVCLPSAGNAAVSAAVYAVAGDLRCRVYLPETIPPSFVEEVRDSGGEVRAVGRTLGEASAAMAEESDGSWFNMATLKEPYRVEGKKTMGLEIAEQLGWEFPDVVVYPAGGGTGLIGIWKAFQELQALDWVRQPLPRMAAVQTAGCAPVVRALEASSEVTEPWHDPRTAALGLNVPDPFGGRWMLTVLRESEGTALTVNEDEIAAAQRQLAELSGVPAGPESGVAWRGYERLVEDGWIKAGERAVVIITGDDRRYG